MNIGTEMPCVQPVLQQRLDRLHGQNDQIESIWKDLYGFSDRLNAIAMRINSVNHPDNLPQEPSNKQNGQQVCEPSISNDGILGRLENIQNVHDVLVNEFHNKIYRSIAKNLEYIEQHI